MAQRLIVEGKDVIVLTMILVKRNLNSPKGYSNSSKYKNEFVKNAEGIENVKKILVEQLLSPDVKNIGIIVDANDKGLEARFNYLKTIVEETLNIPLPNELSIGEKGCIFQISNDLSIGIWVMPDNQNYGYLEHFTEKLISPENPTWKFANDKVDELMEKTFCQFKEKSKQKALIHTYLSWMESPGLPMGTAVSANYLNGLAPEADNFVDWFKNTFEIEE